MSHHADRFPGGLTEWMRLHGYHLLFGITLLSLTALLAWWSVFIRKAIIQQHEQHYESIEYSMMLQAVILGHSQDQPPEKGVLAADPRLEIVPCTDANPTFRKPLEPFWQAYCIQPKQSVIDEIERRYHRQIVMVVGESAMLVLMILVSSFMLYRLIWMEKRAARELREFWSRVTHEIKTPITGLKAFLETLKSGALPPEDVPKYADMALQQISRQVQLTENLLMGRRMSTRGGTGLNVKTIRLDDFIRNYIEEQSNRLDHTQLRIIPKIAADVSVRADPDALRVIFNNLLDNALKYGGDAVTLTITLKKQDGKAEITFEDDGRGFPPETAGAIFEAFHRLTEELPESIHGTGMGLYISRGLARKMGGDLIASSEGPGKGAVFRIYLRLSGEE